MRLLSWVMAVIVVAACVAMLDPASIGLSETVPLAQAIAFRPVLAFVSLGLGLPALTVAAAIGGRRRRRRGHGEQVRRGPSRLLVCGVALTLAGGVHAGLVIWRGVELPGQTPVGLERLPEAGLDDVTVVQLNTLGGGATAETVAELAVAADADVLTLAETTEEQAQAIADELSLRGGVYQVFAEETQWWAWNSTALLVHERLGEYEQVDGPATAAGSVRVEPIDGTGPVLVAVHPIPPTPRAMAGWSADLAQATGVCQEVPGVIVGGDFNATLDHAPMRDIGSCISAAVAGGAGGIGTWPSDRSPWLGTTIDHVLVDADAWEVTGAAVVDVEGSDHRAVVVRLVPTG